MTAKRADHYEWASELVWMARRQLNMNQVIGGAERIELLLGAAQVHATLAAAGPGVEQEALDNERDAARAVAAAEGSQRDRQARRPPLPPRDRAADAADGYGYRPKREEFTRNDDCAELDRDAFGDCDGPIRQYEQIDTRMGLPAGDRVLLCASHARQAMTRDRITPRPIPGGPE